jgi:predicted CXXCH cytochrome family protein
MKRLLAVAAAMLVVSMLAYAQGKQPNGPKTTTQYNRSIMLHGPHDFTVDSGATTPGKPVGAARQLCGYCHAAHVPATGIAAPLWVRASVTGGPNYGVYSNPVSLDATPADVRSDDNYSSFCMSCHDGSFIFTAAAYEAGKRPFVNGGWPAWADTVRVPDGANMYDGEYALTHTHPVNFDYNAALVTNDGGLFTPATTSYVYLDNTTSPPTSIGRLFNGKMQCSSCHNPHFGSGIGLQGSSNYGKLCIACHKQ